jgi:hypothetical protein
MRKWILLVAFLAVSLCSNAEPLIRNFFPRQDLMLGQPLIWTVEIRYPMWESYELKFGNCADVEMNIIDQTLTDVAGELKAVYRISVAPTSLHMSCAPMLMISDEKGQTTILKGKSFNVRTISGDSEEIKSPTLQTSSFAPSSRPILLYFSLVGLLFLCGVFTAKRIYSNTPKQKFLRDVRRAIQEVENKRVPIQVWRILRSEMVWGFSADAFTPSQLSQKALQSPKLLTVASALQSLEKWRYSDSRTSYDPALLIQALGHAAVIVNSNKNRRTA